MLFSVVIPTYNRRHFVLHTLASVRGQRFTYFELIIVDDGSNDGTEDALQHAALPFRLIRQPNRGPGAARNTGAREARGDYLAFLDSDDLWFPWTLGTLARAISTHGRPTLVAGKLIEFVDGVQPRDVEEGPFEALHFTDYLSAGPHAGFVGAGMTVVRRDRFVETGGFTEQRVNCEDHDLILRLGTAPGFVRVLSPTTLAWRRHQAAATADHELGAAGAQFLVEQERGDAYPGGPQRAVDRRRILTLHTRPVSLASLTQGGRPQAWRLYRSTFWWHVRELRWKYLLGFLIKVLTAGAQGRGRGPER